MNAWTRRLISRVIEQVAGSEVGVPGRAIEALVAVLTEDGALKLGAVGGHPIRLAAPL